MTPNSQDPLVVDYRTDPRLLAGQTWTEPRGRFSVSVVSISADSATVAVTPLTPTVVAPASFGVEKASSGATTLNFTIDPATITPGVNEPTGWKVDLVEDPSRSCSASILVPRCSITGLPRGVSFTPRIVFSAPPSTSAPLASSAVVFNIDAPAVTPSFTATGDSVTISVDIDDGGSPLTAPIVLRMEDGRQCSVPISNTGVCTFGGLAANRPYRVTSVGTNAIGVRETSFEVKTSAARPGPLNIAARFDQGDLVVVVTWPERDRTNIVEIENYCNIAPKDGRKWKSTSVGEDDTEVRYVFPGLRTALKCQFAGWSPGDLPAGSARVLQVTRKGKILLPSIKARIVASSPRPGTVVLKWKASDRNGYVQPNLSRVGSKKSLWRQCGSPRQTSCTIKNLKSGSVFSVRLSVWGPSGDAEAFASVVVK